jgi:putative phosphoribosyl transferase
VLNEGVIDAARVTPDAIAEVERRERAELDRRVARYRGGRAPISVAGRPAVIVDDGVATGATARAAIEVVRAMGAASVVLAVPVAPPETIIMLSEVADEVVVVVSPTRMWAIGGWYSDFAQTTDDEVVRLLQQA